jgi:hypothetical protein
MPETVFTGMPAPIAGSSTLTDAVITGSVPRPATPKAVSVVRVPRVKIRDRYSSNVGYVIDYASEVDVERSYLTDLAGVIVHCRYGALKRLWVVDSVVEGDGKTGLHDLVHPISIKANIDYRFLRSSVSGLPQGDHRDLVQVASNSVDALYEESAFLSGRFIITPDTDANWASLDGQHVRTVFRRCVVDELRAFNCPDMLIEGGKFPGIPGSRFAAGASLSSYRIVDLRACLGDNDDRSHATTCTIHNERIGILKLGGMSTDRAPLQGVTISEESGGCEVGEIIGRDASPEVRRRLTRTMTPVPNPIPPTEPEPSDQEMTTNAVQATLQSSDLERALLALSEENMKLKRIVDAVRVAIAD